MKIPFNKPYMSEAELAYIAEAHANGHLSGDGLFTKRCNAWLEAQTGTKKAMLTHSCTAALEICAMLAFSAIKNNDKVGLIIFSDYVEKYVAPKKGKKQAP